MKICPADASIFPRERQTCKLCGTVLAEVATYGGCPQPECALRLWAPEFKRCPLCGQELVAVTARWWASKCLWPRLAKDLQGTLDNLEAIFQQAEKVGISYEVAQVFFETWAEYAAHPLAAQVRLLPRRTPAKTEAQPGAETEAQSKVQPATAVAAQPPTEPASPVADSGASQPQTVPLPNVVDAADEINMRWVAEAAYQSLRRGEFALMRQPFYMMPAQDVSNDFVSLIQADGTRGHLLLFLETNNRSGWLVPNPNRYVVHVVARIFTWLEGVHAPAPDSIAATPVWWDARVNAWCARKQ